MSTSARRIKACLVMSGLFVMSALAGGPDMLYFLDQTASFANSLWRVNLDGTSKERILQGQGGASTNLGHAVSLAIQRSAPGYVYIAETWSNYRLGRTTLGGTDFTAIRTGGNYSAMALDPENKKIYFSYDTGICRVNLNGSGIEVLVSGASALAMALDLTNSKMYWIQGTQIKSANLDGSGVAIILGDIVLVGTTGIGLDIPNGKIYWTENHGAPDYIPSNLKRANLDGSNVEIIFTAAKWAEMGALALNLNNKKVYFKSAAGTVSYIPADGGTASTLLTGQTLITAMALYLPPPSGTIFFAQ